MKLLLTNSLTGKIVMKHYFFSFFIIFGIFIFSGCGGGGDSSSAPLTATLTGTVAIGAPVEANITLIDANGIVKQFSSDSNGTYSVNVNGLNTPFILRAQSIDGTFRLYSYVLMVNSVVNITPITTYILDRSAFDHNLSGVAELFDKFSSKKEVLSDVNTTVAELNTSLNPFTTPFRADHTGYDAFLDALDIETHGDDIVIRTDKAILKTTQVSNIESNVSIEGKVVDQLGTALANATILFKGNSTPILLTTDTNGNFTANVESNRNYTLVINGESIKTIHTFSGNLNLGALSVSPFATFTLTWGNNPEDLDSWLSGPKVGGDRYYIATHTPEFSLNEAVIAKLNEDANSNKEITKIYRSQNGVYKYYVHHYRGNGSIATSIASVMVKTQSEIQTFTPPSTGFSGMSGDLNGDVWYVCDINTDGSITAINTVLHGIDAIE